MSYQLPEAAKVILTLFHLLGQEIRMLVNEKKAADFYFHNGLSK